VSRRAPRVLLAALAAAACAAPATAAPGAPSPPPAPLPTREAEVPPPAREAEAPPPLMDPAADFLTALDRHRARVGCPPLQWHEGAAGVAQAHSDDMRRRGYFDHVSPEGVGMRARLQAAGVTARPAAENLVDAPFGGERLLNRWLSSSVHRSNIEDCGFTHHGLGRSGDLWTHLFLTVRPAAPRRER